MSTFEFTQLKRQTQEVLMMKSINSFIKDFLYYVTIFYLSSISLQAASDSLTLFPNWRDVEAINAYQRPLQLEVNVENPTNNSKCSFYCRIGKEENIPITIKDLQLEFPSLERAITGFPRVKITLTISSLSELDESISSFISIEN